MDLENISKTLKIDKDEIINIHLNTVFFVYTWLVLYLGIPLWEI